MIIFINPDKYEDITTTIITTTTTTTTDSLIKSRLPGIQHTKGLLGSKLNLCISKMST